MAISIKPYKGTRDFYPEDMAFRKWMFSKLRQTVEAYGYHEYEGPMLESFEIYAAKTGEEIVNQQLYHFEDRGGRKVAMRPEMTPTMARMVAGRLQELAKPIRWYSIPNLWRYERPQRGRLREHWQLNVDLLGGDNILADTEILQTAFDIIRSFNGEDQIKIRVNNRKLVNFVFTEQLRLSAEQALKASKAIDAREKIGDEAYTKLLNEAEISNEQAKSLESFFNSTLEDLQGQYECEGAREILSVFDNFKGNNQMLNALVFDPQIMRGLDYYTGTVFEVFDVSPDNNRAMFGGGRYDNLVGLFGKQTISGVGFGMGDVTLQNFLETHQLIPESIVPQVDAYMILPDMAHYPLMNQIAQQLRSEGYSVATPLASAKFAAQLKLANKANARFAVILGENEIKTQTAAVKNLATGEQTTIAVSDLSNALK